VKHSSLLASALGISLMMIVPSQAAAQTRPQAAQNAALVDLTPANSVLVYVDFNTGLDNQLTTVPGPQFRNNAAAYARLGQVLDMPIALFGEENEYFGPFYPEITPLKAKGRQFLRTTPSGYTPEFAAWLRGTGRRNVIIGGISIDNCTLHTTLDLLRNGYNVYVVTDVSPTNTALAHEAAMNRMTQAGAVPVGWIGAATDLIGDWNSPAGRAVMPLMQQHLAASTIGTPVDTTPDGKGFGPAPR